MNTPEDWASRAARNVFAGTTGSGITETELAFAITPQLEAEARLFAVAAIDGPFGQFVPAQEDGDAACDGYVLALRETIADIDNMVIRVPSRETAQAVHEVLALVKNSLQERIDALTVPSGTDEIGTLADLLASFGIQIAVVPVEPATR